MKPQATTDDQSEIFTWVNEDDVILGPISRKVAHSDNKKIHRSIGILILNDRQEMLFQTRSLTKDKNPGFISYGVGGHVTFGDDYLKTALRELKEELSITADIHFITKSIIRMETETEMCSFFTTRIKSNAKLKHDPREIMQLQWILQHDIGNFIQGKPIASWTLDALRITGYL